MSSSLSQWLCKNKDLRSKREASLKLPYQTPAQIAFSKPREFLTIKCMCVYISVYTLHIQFRHWNKWLSLGLPRYRHSKGVKTQLHLYQVVRHLPPGGQLPTASLPFIKLCTWIHSVFSFQTTCFQTVSQRQEESPQLMEVVILLLWKHPFNKLYFCIVGFFCFLFPTWLERIPEVSLGQYVQIRAQSGKSTSV